jgi:hypothetical protein
VVGVKDGVLYFADLDEGRGPARVAPKLSVDLVKGEVGNSIGHCACSLVKCPALRDKGG